MKIIGFTIGAVLIFGACTDIETTVSNDATDKTEEPGTDLTIKDDTTSKSATPKFSYKLVVTPEGDWGYHIFEGSKILIKQELIPAVQGKSGFDTKEKAEKTALFIINKLENNIFPPRVTPEELDSLGVLPEVK
ncbi:MAG: hypothetical protein ACI837_002421 [Crocinitomicaceae bacterium]|jgi:hypothetical protein